MTTFKFTLLIAFTLTIGYGCKKESTNYDWKNYSLKDPVDLQAISMLNENVGYIGGIPLIDSSEQIYYRIDYPSCNLKDSLLLELDPNEIRSEFSGIPQSAALYKTNNGGLSWQSISTPFISGIVDLDFINEQIGFVVTAKEGLFKTTDGGKHWNKILSNFFHLYKEKQRSNCINKVVFYDENIGYAYQTRNESLILKTTDGGLSWKCLSLRYPNHITNTTESTISENFINFISFGTSKDIGFISCDKSEIHKTSDGGEKWTQITHEKEFYGHFFIQNTNILCPAIGSISKDECDTWQEVSVLENPSIGCLAEDETLYYFSGLQIYFNKLDVKRGTPMSSELGEVIINKIAFTSPNLGFAIGPNGTILRYSK